MPRIWMRNDHEGWRAVHLDGRGIILLTDNDPPDSAASVLPAAGDGRTLWCLVAAAGREARVNGWAIPGGVRILSDRDEIRLSRHARYYYSDADPAIVEPFPASVGAVPCGLCTAPIDPGTDAVRCPRCSVWHHANDERNCWTYNSVCSQCDQPTALTGDSVWSPDND